MYGFELPPSSGKKLSELLHYRRRRGYVSPKYKHFNRNCPIVFLEIIKTSHHQSNTMLHVFDYHKNVAFSEKI